MVRSKRSKKARVAMSGFSSQGLAILDRDAVKPGEETFVARECFAHWAVGDEIVDDHDLLEALADFGLQATTEEERLAVNELIKEHSKAGERTDLDRFLALIPDCRATLRMVSANSIFQAWKSVDVLDTGFMQKEQCLAVLKFLRLTPAETELENTRVGVFLSELPPCNHNGEVTLGEVEFLVGFARELRLRTRRKSDRDIKECLALPPLLVDEFRGQLTEFRKAYEQGDSNSSEALDYEETVHILSDVGLLCGGLDRTKEEAIIQEYLDVVQRCDLEADSDEEAEIDFPTFLAIVHRLRGMERQRWKAAVEGAIAKVDTDAKGFIRRCELCQLLVELDLLPKTAPRQDLVAKLLHDIDAECISGTFTVDELHRIVQLVNEKLLMAGRGDDMARGSALGFDRHQVHAFREIFDKLDGDDFEGLAVDAVGKVPKLVSLGVSGVVIVQLAASCKTAVKGRFSFSEFLELMRKVIDAARAAQKEEEKAKSLQARRKGAVVRCADEGSQEKATPQSSQLLTSEDSGASEPSVPTTIWNRGARKLMATMRTPRPRPSQVASKRASVPQALSRHTLLSVSQDTGTSPRGWSGHQRRRTRPRGSLFVSVQALVSGADTLPG